MVNRPSVPEIITVNSEDLQTQIRDLLPSQNGFGSELQATNVITPIIDLTRSAEGSGLPSYLQTALAHGSNTPFDLTNTSANLITAPGFYRIYGVSQIDLESASGGTNFSITDGLATKKMWEHSMTGGTADQFSFLEYDFIVFLRAGDTLTGFSDNSVSNLSGSHRQIATGDGTLIQPNGFPL
jgi:hypothetical protein